MIKALMFAGLFSSTGIFAQKNIAIINSDVKDQELIIKSLTDTKIYFADVTKTSGQIINEIISQNSSTEIKNLMIFGHGEAGQFQLGSTKINSQKLKSKKRIKPNKVILIPRPKNCPKCNGIRFYKHDKYYRTIIDLKISKTAIKRQVTLYHMDRFECRDCSYVFTPKDSITLSGGKYGRSLSCWIINQSVF